MNIVNPIALDAIKKKLLGKQLTYNEIYSVMDEISHERLGPVLTTYFSAAGFREGFGPDELYWMTKAMVETGKQLHFGGIVADKHSMGGVAGTRSTMIIVPIVAAAGFLIPKTSSRAITVPTGTADAMEVLAPVTFTDRQVESIVSKTGGCIVWGGNLGLAPADDALIRVSEPLAFESYDKAIVSIMAKKIALGATHVVIDVPVGPSMKIRHHADAEVIARKFEYLGERFGVNVLCDINEIQENAGRGVGPVLEARDVLDVLEQRADRPLALETRALHLAGKLLTLCLSETHQKDSVNGYDLARKMLSGGRAMAKMREIVRAQGGNPHFESARLKPAEHTYEMRSPVKGVVSKLDNREITVICRILGCPSDKGSGIYLNRKLGENVDKNDILCTLYSSDKWRLKEAVETLKNVAVYHIA